MRISVFDWKSKKNETEDSRLHVFSLISRRIMSNLEMLRKERTKE